MSRKHLLRNPRHIKRNGKRVEHWWFYEESYGIDVIHEPSEKMVNVTIPIAAIRAYLRRKDRTR